MLDFLTSKKGKSGLVGVSVNAEKLSIAHITSGQNGPQLAFCEEFPATTDQEREEILEQQVSRRELENAATNFVLEPSDYKLFLVESPRVEPHEMDAAVKWKIKDLVDSPVDELAVTLFPVPEDAYRGQNEMVYAVAARKPRIRHVVDLIFNADLKLQSIDIPELALTNITSRFADDSNGLAFIDLRSSGSTLNLCRGGNIYLTRHLNTRVDHDIISSPEWEGVREKLVLEIQRSLDYYESQMGQSPISKILLAPRENDTEELASQLNESMSVQVSGLNLADYLANDNAEDFPMALQQSCIYAIGGALRLSRAAAASANKSRAAA